MMTDGGLSVMSEATVFTGKLTHAEKNLSKMGQKRKDDFDKLKYQVEELKEELTEVKKKYKAAVARRDTLEGQVKSIKTDLGMKMRTLLDKTENDDKLIQMLKQEITRLESTKGVKSNLGTENKSEAAAEIHRLKRDCANLKN